MKEFFLKFISAIILTTVVTGIAYGAISAAIYFTADEVECGSIGPIPYCSGTYKQAETQIHQNISKSCYRNGERVNCSEINWKPGITKGREAIP